MTKHHNFVTVDDELIIRYLLKETNEEESSAIDAWAAFSSENKKKIDEYAFTIDIVDLSKPDLENEWAKLQKRLGKKKSFHIPIYKWAIAASITLLIGLSLFFLFNKSISTTIIYAESKDEIIDITLRDGTQITLNRQSSLEYPKIFDNKKRVVKLHGEAYFHVTHQAQHPFVVQTNDIQITVLGTVFYVRSFPGEQSEVYVEEGAVECLHIQSGHKVILHAGEMYKHINHSQYAAPAEQMDKNTFAWKTGILNFSNTPLNEIISTVNQVYGTQIELEESLSDCHLTVNFKHLSIESILNILDNILNISIEKKPSQIVIKGEGC